jgi:hypothetical protein
MQTKKKVTAMRNDFAAFILTHGRPHNVLTYQSLKFSGYTGRIIVVADNEDRQLDNYRKNFKNELYVFDKKEIARTVDACDNYDKRNSVVYARNCTFKIAKELGIRYIWQLDDDYPSFHWSADNDKNYLTTTTESKIRNLDAVLDACLEFMLAAGAKSVAFAQGGDFIGGGDGRFFQKWKSGQLSRKAMNSFILDVDNPCVFRGRVNDDVNLYVEGGRRGELFATFQRLRVQQPQTQKNEGGCTEIYLEMGTYIKSFYSVMVAPSCVKIASMGEVNRRIHHMVSWKHCCPVIIDEKYRKPR